MKIRKILPVICLCGVLLPLTCGCGKKEKDTAKGEKSAVAGSSELPTQKQIAAPAQKRAKGGGSPYTQKTFARKGRPTSESSQVTVGNLKKGQPKSEGDEEKQE